MNGLNLIIEKIESDNSKEVKKILDDSIEKANEILNKSEEEAKKEASDIISASEKNAIQIEENMKSSCEAFLKNEVLKEKSDLINQITDETVSEIILSPPKEYFEILKKLIIKYAHENSEGILCLNENDLKWLPSNFMKELNKELKKQEACVTLNKEAINISGGFILSYGKIEENCSFEALVEEKREIIRDKIRKTERG